MDVSFTNNLFAGAYVMKKDLSSDLKTLSLANTNETFQSEFHYVRERNEDGKRTMIWLNENEYLVFRTRTTVEDGKLNYAHYVAFLYAFFFSLLFPCSWSLSLSGQLAIK